MILNVYLTYKSHNEKERERYRYHTVQIKFFEASREHFFLEKETTLVKVHFWNS